MFPWFVCPSGGTWDKNRKAPTRLSKVSYSHFKMTRITLSSLYFFALLMMGPFAHLSINTAKHIVILESLLAFSLVVADYTVVLHKNYKYQDIWAVRSKELCNLI